MGNSMLQAKINVKGSVFNVIRVDEFEYISLTDLAKTNFKLVEFDQFKNQAGRHASK